MPFFVFGKIGLKEIKNTAMSLQMVDRSIKYYRGIVDDVLVKVDKLYFPMDFVILDMDDDSNMPLILGTPFLNTRKTLTGVQKSELILRFGDEIAHSMSLTP